MSRPMRQHVFSRWQLICLTGTRSQTRPVVRSYDGYARALQLSGRIFRSTESITGETRHLQGGLDDFTSLTRNHSCRPSSLLRPTFSGPRPGSALGGAKQNLPQFLKRCRSRRFAFGVAMPPATIANSSTCSTANPMQGHFIAGHHSLIQTKSFLFSLDPLHAASAPRTELSSNAQLTEFTSWDRSVHAVAWRTRNCLILESWCVLFQSTQEYLRKAGGGSRSSAFS